MLKRRRSAVSDVLLRSGQCQPPEPEMISRTNVHKMIPDIQPGYEAVEKAGFGSNADRPRLFRFPDYKSTPGLTTFIRSRHATITGVNMSAADWLGLPATITMQRVKMLFDRQKGRGILGLHDNQENTVDLLPMIIAELKARNMHIVHLTVD